MPGLTNIITNITFITNISIIIATIFSKIINQHKFTFGLGITCICLGALGIFFWFFLYDNLLLIISTYMIIVGIVYIIDFELRPNDSTSNMRAYTISFIIFFTSIYKLLIEFSSNKSDIYIHIFLVLTALTSFIVGIYFASIKK